MNSDTKPNAAPVERPASIPTQKGRADSGSGEQPEHPRRVKPVGPADSAPPDPSPRTGLQPAPVRPVRETTAAAALASEVKNPDDPGTSRPATDIDSKPPQPAARPAGSGSKDPHALVQAAAARSKRADPAPEPEAQPGLDLTDSELFLNREFTWLEFNRRVLHEAEDERTPLLERVKFLAIVSSNLDEFFMKRIGGLKQQVGAGVHDLTVDGRTPQQQIDGAYAIVRELEAQKELLWGEVKRRLEAHDIFVLSHDDLDEEQKDALREHYIENIYPLVTPQAVDPAHPFPFVSNLSLNLLVSLGYEGNDAATRARVKVPVGKGAPRFIRVGEGNRFVPLEQVISNNLDLLFPKLEVQSCELFHVTRNANLARDEERADDLLAMIETEVRERRFAPIVRVMVQSDMDAYRRGMLAAELGLDEGADVFETDGMMEMRDLFELASLDIPAIEDSPHHPVDNHRLHDAPNIFYAIRDTGGVLLQHPYESFTNSVERFVREASRDPKVRAIKMTLYRTSGDTKILDYLIDAATNGKQVAVSVELKARFDEAANIRWASRLEEAGIHVTYGVMGLKTHCKVILVVRQDFNGLTLYAHIGTGNYHAGTARLYDDLGLLTCDPDIGRDLVELFNYLTTGYTPKRNFRKILPAPKLMKRGLLHKIDREVEKHDKDHPGRILIKANALEDPDVTRALYRAAHAGVQVDLLIRDTCRLRPGLKGLSENVRVVSIVGRFLEHSRVYYFRNGGESECFIGSADAMIRNLEMRVEVLVPVEDPQLQQELIDTLELRLNDRRNAWQMDADGNYTQRMPEQEGDAGCQEQLIQRAEKRLHAVKRLKHRKPRVITGRNQSLTIPGN